MESEMQEKIEETVVEILKGSDMSQVSEYKVRKMASEKLGVDLSVPDRKQFVRQVVESFLRNLQSSTEADGSENQDAAPEPGKQENKDEEEEEEEDDRSKIVGAKEYDDDGDLIICRLSDRRRVTIQDFRGKTLVSIREYYRKDGKELPSSKGISLPAEQWSILKKNVSAVEEAIRTMEARI